MHCISRGFLLTALFVSVDQPLTLHFHNFEVCLFGIYYTSLPKFLTNHQTIILFVSVFLVNLLLMSVSLLPRGSFLLVKTQLACFRDGKANYLEGLMLLTLYLVIALACKLPIQPFNHLLIAISLGDLRYRRSLPLLAVHILRL
jgi:Ca2+/H+ antiporter